MGLCTNQDTPIDFRSISFHGSYVDQHPHLPSDGNFALAGVEGGGHGLVAGREGGDSLAIVSHHHLLLRGDNGVALSPDTQACWVSVWDQHRLAALVFVCAEVVCACVFVCSR